MLALEHLRVHSHHDKNLEFHLFPINYLTVIYFPTNAQGYWGTPFSLLDGPNLFEILYMSWRIINCIAEYWLASLSIMDIDSAISSHVLTIE